MSEASASTKHAWIGPEGGGGSSEGSEITPLRLLFHAGVQF